MRFYLVAILSILFAACEPQPDGVGTKDHACRTTFFFPGCNEDLVCVDDICRSCGDEGEFCCDGLLDYCHGNLACEVGFDGQGQCTADCGSVGMSCCPGFDECPNGGKCVNGMCEADPVDTCFSGSTKHVMYVITGECNATELIFFTNTVAEAEACRQKFVDIALPTEEICPLDQEPEFTTVCSYSDALGYSEYGMPNCSAAQLQTCEQYWCSNCTWTTGDCP